MNFVRIFNTLKLWMPMIPTPGRMPFNLFSSIRLLVACCGLLLACGCQKLFHDQDALLKGRTVAVSMSVQDTPPPAAQALPVAESAAPAPALPLRPLDQRLLPTQQPVSMQPSQPLAASSERPAATARQQLAEAAVVLTERVMTEDLVLRGTVLVKGSLIVAPQATLRIEAGTTVRFAADPTVLQPGRLVVQGRLVISGTAQQPVLLGSAYQKAEPGDWGGVVLLGSEKKNSIDHCRIEGAQTGVLVQNAYLNARGLQVTTALRGIELHGSEVSLQGSSISRCDIGIRLVDSEADLRDSTIRENRQGIAARRTSGSLSNVTVSANAQEGIEWVQGRYRVSGSLVAGNRTGARFTDADGHLTLCRFHTNRAHGVELSAGQVRIRNSSFTGNGGVGLLLEQVQGMMAGSALHDNQAGNLENRGQEPFPALLNWWGSADQQRIAAGILTAPRQDGLPLVPFVPFLKERPATAP